MPPGGTVKQVAVQRTRVGHRYRWEALITIEANYERSDTEAKGVVGVDIGWRIEPDGQRVATHDSAKESFVLRTDTLDAFLYSDAVRGTRDQVFDDAKAYAKQAGIPGAEHATQWKDKSRMHRLAKTTNNLGLAWWVQVDKHLEDIECGVRARAMRRRLDAYRVYADGLAKRYQIVALEDMPMQDWVGEGETHARERRRSVAALSLLQGVIIQRVGPSRIDWVPCAYTTMTCALCGVPRKERVGAAPFWTCECGEVHHQDENAAEVIRLDSERWIGDGNPPRARKRKPKTKKGKEVAAAGKPTEEGSTEGTSREPCAEAAE
jgi:hypothetical protein